MSLHMMGSFDWGSFGGKAKDALTPVASEAAKTIGTMQDAKKVIAADEAATKANAEALFTEYYAKDKSPSNVTKAENAKVLADAAFKAQDAAAEGISDDVKSKRVDAAVKASKDATNGATMAAAGGPGVKDEDIEKAKAFAKAAAITVEKARGDKKQAEMPKEKFDPKDSIAQPPMPTWEIAALTVGGLSFLTGIVMVVKKAMGK